MDPANGKHTSVHTKTPEIKQNPANKPVEPGPTTAGGLSVDPAAAESGRFTFVTVSAAVGVEVISAPQPAHLRHLGQLALTSDVTGAFSFFLLSQVHAAAPAARAHAHARPSSDTHTRARPSSHSNTHTSINLNTLYFTHNPPLFIGPPALLNRVFILFAFF